MIVSLNQIETTARKAARGAGLPWGLADEAGKAARWLHAHGLNGAAVLAAYLATVPAATQNKPGYAACAPAGLSGVWHAPGGALDPIATGAALSDHITGITGGGVETGAIAYPLLAAALVGVAAEIKDFAFVLSWPGVRLHCRPGGVRVADEPDAVETAIAECLRCHAYVDELAAGAWRATHTGEVEVAAKVWRNLEQHARRTHVAGSESSRLSGAGAGLRDND